MGRNWRELVLWPKDASREGLVFIERENDLLVPVWITQGRGNTIRIADICEVFEETVARTDKEWERLPSDQIGRLKDWKQNVSLLVKLGSVRSGLRSGSKPHHKHLEEVTLTLRRILTSDLRAFRRGLRKKRTTQIDEQEEEDEEEEAGTEEETEEEYSNGEEEYDNENNVPRAIEGLLSGTMDGRDRGIGFINDMLRSGSRGNMHALIERATIFKMTDLPLPHERGTCDACGLTRTLSHLLVIGSERQQKLMHLGCDCQQTIVRMRGVYEWLTDILATERFDILPDGQQTHIKRKYNQLTDALFEHETAVQRKYRKS